MRIIKVLIFSIVVFGVSVWSPTTALAGELYSTRNNNFDRYFDFRSRSLYYNHRSFARWSTAAAAKFANPFITSRGSGANAFEERRWAYMRAQYNYNVELYEFQVKQAERTARLKQREVSHRRTEEIRMARVRAVESRKTVSSSSRPQTRGRLADDLFGSSTGAAKKSSTTKAVGTNPEPQKPGLWNRLKSAVFGS